MNYTTYYPLLIRLNLDWPKNLEQQKYSLSTCPYFPLFFFNTILEDIAIFDLLLKLILPLLLFYFLFKTLEIH